MRRDTNDGQGDGGIPSAGGRGGSAGHADAVDLAAVFDALPGVDLVLAPDAPRYTMLAATAGRLAATMTTREGTLGRPLFEVFPDANPDNPGASGAGNLRASLDTVLRTGAPHRMTVQRYDLRRPDGTWEERHWAPLNLPVLGPDGAVRYVVHRVEDVTESVRLAAEGDRLRAAAAGSERARVSAEAARDEVAAAHVQLQAQALERELANQRLQELAAELEAQAETLREGAAALAERTAAAERALAALAASEARFRTVQDASPLGFCIHRPIRDADGAVVDFVTPYINAAGARIVGQRPERVMTERLLAIWPMAGVEGIIADYARVLATGAPNVRELLYEHEELAAGLTLTAVRIGDGPDAELGITFTDITARLRAERERDRLLSALGAERERLRDLILHMPAPLALLEGPEHRFALANAAYRRISGGGRDVTGLTPREAYPELAGTGIHELFDRVWATGEAWVGPETHVRYDRDGTGVRDVWMDARIDPVRDAAGDVVALLNFNVDVTEQVLARRESQRLLDEARAARAEAEAANRAKGEFLAVMSHELRTPLNAIGGYAQLLDMGLHGPVTDAQRAALGRVQAAQRRLLALVNDVLNYARLESGRVEYTLGVVDVRDVIADVAPLVEPQLAAKGLALEVRLPDGPCAVWTDREKLGQVLVNLLSNATKFTDARHPATGAPGRVTVAVSTRPGAAADAVFLRVSDTGRGIPREKQAAIFEPFVQVRAGPGSAYAQATEGTGLGLAISRDLSRGMGGDLRVRSREGEGAAFTVVLRRATAPDGTTRDRRTHEERRVGADRRSGEDRRADPPEDDDGP